MAVRPATQEEIDSLTEGSAEDIAPTPLPDDVPQVDIVDVINDELLAQPIARMATQEEISSMVPIGDAEEEGDEEPSVFDRIIERALGTDVEDPLELERLGTIVLGGLAGSFAGAKTPPLGPIVNPITGGIAGGLVGTVAGAVAPEATMEALEFLNILPEGSRKEKGLSNEELRRVTSGEALLELATVGAAGSIRASGRLVGRAATGITKESEKLAARAAKEGVDLAPFQLGSSDLGKGIVNVLGRFPFIGGKARQVGAAAETTLKAMKESLPSRVFPLISTSRLGTKIFNDARNLVTKVSTKFEEKYGALFLDANKLGVKYNPSNTRNTGNKILTQLKARRPTTKETVEQVVEGVKVSTEKISAAKGAQATEKMMQFIKNNVLNLEDQSLAQMDEILMKISQQISSAKKGTKPALAKLMAPLKAAVKTDIMENGIGQGAQEIGERMAKIDADFSETMLFFFETSAGARFGNVRRGGLKGTVLPSKAATRTAVDKFANIVIDIDSPQAIDELSRLVDKKTFSEIGGRVLADVFDESMIELADGTIKLNADKLAKSLGKVGTDTSRSEALGLLFKKSGMPTDAINTLVDAATVISKSPIPNWSTFIARRAGIGGAKSVLRGVMPFLALTGGAASGGAVGALIGGMLFLGGSRTLISAISNPVSARAFKEVASKEASMLVKRAAFLRMARAGVTQMQTLKEFTVETANTLLEDAKIVAKELFPDKQKKRPSPQDFKESISGRGLPVTNRTNIVAGGSR